MFYAAIMLSGGFGVLLRYLVFRATTHFPVMTLPYATLIVNVIGSFLMGYLSWALVHKMQVSRDLQTLVLTGFLGGFTTFSAFSIEVVTLFEQGASLRAIIYICISVLLCVMMCLCGLLLARHT